MTGHCAYINVSCKKWETGCGNCTRLSEYPKAYTDRSEMSWKLKKELFDRFDEDKLCFVPVSNYLARYAEESLFGNHMIQIIQNGVDVDKIKSFEGKHSEIIQVHRLKQVHDNDYCCQVDER